MRARVLCQRASKIIDRNNLTQDVKILKELCARFMQDGVKNGYYLS